jgi:branched-chain amino acid transport system ATP-binding protein
MLELHDIRVRYGAIEALAGVSLTVEAGEIVCLIGANGAGKSTVLNAISGVVPLDGGSSKFEGGPLSKLGSTQIVRKGVVQVPEGRLVFPDLTVLENLEMGGYTQPSASFQASLDAVFALFPRLADRRQQLAGLMSGGEQQMLAIGRALTAKPKLLLLDEPSMGLAPLVIVDIFQSLRRLRTELGMTILLVEQNARAALSLSDRGYVLVNGRIAKTGKSADLAADPAIREAFLGSVAEPRIRTQAH